MYIDTGGKELMEESVCKILNIDNMKLDDLLVNCFNSLQDDHPVFMLDEQYDFFLEYVKEHRIKQIDRIMLTHLGRRLDNDDNGYSFNDVLTKETSLSKYLKEFGITFKDDKHLKMYIDNQEVKLVDDYAGKYLKQRFGYSYQDYEFSGIAFCDNVLNNEYYEITRGGPEFFGYLYPYIDNDAIIDNFIENSRFYQFDYLVSVNEIEFVNYEELTNLEKQYHIIVKTLQRLYFYKYELDFIREVNCDVKLVDNRVLSSECLINKKVIE